MPQGIESTRSAAETGKRLLNLVFQHHDAFLAEVTALWQAFEAEVVREEARMSRSARILMESGEAELAVGLLTYFSTTEMRRALRPRRCHREEPRSEDEVAPRLQHRPDPDRSASALVRPRVALRTKLQ